MSENATNETAPASDQNPRVAYYTRLRRDSAISASADGAGASAADEKGETRVEREEGEKGEAQSQAQVQGEKDSAPTSQPHSQHRSRGRSDFRPREQNGSRYKAPSHFNPTISAKTGRSGDSLTWDENTEPASGVPGKTEGEAPRTNPLKMASRRQSSSSSAVGVAKPQSQPPRESSVASAFGKQQSRPSKSALGAGDLDPRQKIVSVSGVEGKLSALNEIARKSEARAIIHTGNFGFYDAESPARLPIDSLRYIFKRGTVGLAAVAEDAVQVSDEEVLEQVQQERLLSELPDFICGSKRLDVPIYVVWGQYEDIDVIEKFRKGVYHVPNLYILDHRNSYAISTGTVSLRLFGLGGSFAYSRLFDVGEGSDVVSGGQGKAWVNMVQIGELIELADRYDNPQEIRALVTNAPPGKEPLAQLIASYLKAHFTLSCSPDFNQCSLYSDISVHSVATFCAFLKPTQEDIRSMWDQVYFAMNESFTYPDNAGPWEVQRSLCVKALAVLDRTPSTEDHLQRCTHVTLPSIASGQVLIGLENGRVGIQTATHIAAKPPVAAKPAPTSALSLCQITPSTTTASMEATISPLSSTDELPPLAKEEGCASPRVTADVRYEEGFSPSLNQDGGQKYFIDNQGTGGAARLSGRSAELTLYLGNLPRFITGAALDEAALKKYDIVSIDFLSPAHEVAAVTFNSKEELERAILEMKALIVHGRPVRARRDRFMAGQSS